MPTRSLRRLVRYHDSTSADLSALKQERAGSIGGVVTSPGGGGAFMCT